MHAMQPFFQTVLNFEGFEFVAFWLGLFIALMAAGFFVDMIMQKQGFGPMLNAGFALGGGFLGLYLRFNYFSNSPWYSYEPFVTTVLCFGSIAGLLLMLAYLRNVFWK